MKKILLVTAALMLAHVAAFAQSEIVFDNNVNASGTPGDFPGTVKAPIYNISPNAPTLRVSGNTAAGVPMGSTTYAGALLNGTGFTATLWGLNSANVTGSADLGANNLALLANGVTTMRTSTSAANAGRFAGTGVNAVISDVRPGTTDRGTFQVRVWDNKGGTITSWDAAVAAFQRGGEAIGYSDLFTVPWSLTQIGGLGTPSNLEGLRSFNLFTVVPEPSVIALGVLGAGCLFLLRRRK